MVCIIFFVSWLSARAFSLYLCSTIMETDSIVQRCKKGDRAAWKELYDIFAPQMLVVCHRYSPSGDVARDLLHDGFIKIFSKIDSFRGNGSFEGWMRRVFVTLALERIRREKKILFDDQIITSLPTENDDYPELLERISQGELFKIIDSLPIGYHTVLKLYCVDGYSHSEIAKMLKITPETSRSQLSRAKVELKKRLKRC